MNCMNNIYIRTGSQSSPAKWPAPEQRGPPMSAGGKCGSVALATTENEELHEVSAAVTGEESAEVPFIAASRAPSTATAVSSLGKSRRSSMAKWSPFLASERRLSGEKSAS